MRKLQSSNCCLFAAWVDLEDKSQLEVITMVLLAPRLQPCQSLRKQLNKSWWGCAQKVNTTHFNWECKLIQSSSFKNRYGGFLKILENMPFLWLSYVTPECSPQRLQDIAESLAQRYLLYHRSQLPNCVTQSPTLEGWVRKWALYTQWHCFWKEEISHVPGRKMDATGGNRIKQIKPVQRDK